MQQALAGRYQVEEEVGRGAMAVVFRCRDLRHDRPVALKVVHPELRALIGGERFLREVQVAARLQHSHIVPLFDSGAAGGLVYYTMPLLTGEPLRARLDREGPLEIGEAIRLASQVGEALDYAHRQGVVHRDIKPENILLHEGNALVADFGVALAVTGSGDARLTASGFVVGTPAYMSPEQATGAPVDARSDIYSLSAVLYEMLTDELPHGGGSTPELVARKLADTPRAVGDFRRGIPPHVAAAIDRALSRRPEERFATAREFVQALSGAAPVRRARQPRLTRPVLFGAIGVLLALAGTVWLARNRARPRPPADPALVVAAPLAAAGGGDLRQLGTTLLELLNGALPGEPGLRLVAAGAGGAARRQAERLGAGRLLTGTVSEAQSGIAVRLELQDLMRGRLLGQATATGSRDSLPVMARALALRLLQLEAARGDQAALALLPASLPALAALNTGIARYRAARYPSAVESFGRAIEADSSLAVAGLWLIMAGRKYGGGVPGMQEYAWSRRASLSPRDQAVLQALLGTRYPEPYTHREWMANMEAAVAAADDRPELWTELGGLLARYGAYLGLPDALTRAEGALLQALRYDPGFPAALQFLVEVRGRRGDRAGLEWAASRFLELDPDGELAPYVEWRLALVRGDSARRSRLVGRMPDWNGVALAQLVWSTQLDGLPPADALAASDALLQRAATPGDRKDKLVFRHDLLANLGRPAEAAQTIRQMREVDSSWTGWRSEAVRDHLFWDGERALAAEAMASFGPWPAGPPVPDSALRARQRVAACWHGAWQAWRGSRDSLRGVVSWLGQAERRDPPASLPSCGFVLGTVLSVLEGEPGAVKRLDSLDGLARTGRVLVPFSAASNLALSELYQRLGNGSRARLAASRYWYLGRTLHVSSYLFQSGQLAMADGDSAAAVAALTRVATLWSAGDSAHRARSDSLSRVLRSIVITHP